MKGESIIKKNYIFWTITIGLIILTSIMIRSYVLPLLSAFVVAYLILPIYKLISKKIEKKLAAAICIFLIIVVLLVPLASIANNLVGQASKTLQDASIDSLIKNLSENQVVEKFNINLDGLEGKVGSLIIYLIQSTISALPSIIIYILIMVLGIYYILTNWDYLTDYLKKYLPFQDKERISKEIAGYTNSIIYGYLLIALLEFTIGFIGFYLAGVEYYIILPLLIALFAFIPGLGPFIIWAPTALYYFLIGEINTAIIVLITGLIISLIIDTFIAARVLGSKTKTNPLLIIIGILGGIPLFGIFGIIIGPLLLVYTLKLVQEGIKQD